MMTFCVCVILARLCELENGCPLPRLRAKVRLVSDDPCAKATNPDGEFLLTDIPDGIGTEPGKVCTGCPLPANTGLDEDGEPASILPAGSTHYVIEVCDLNTGQVLVGPCRFQLDANAEYELDDDGCVDLAQLIELEESA